MANKIPRVPVREQDSKVRATNFDEVCYGYNVEEAMLEATRCLHCKNPRCVGACPVGIKIPEFIEKVKDGDFAAAAAVIAEDSSLPAICGRVCPQETQCEGSCILGVKGESVAIGPMIMMKFTTLTAKKLGLPIVVSLNTLMVDGTGMCGACRVTVGGKTRFACVEGPEFDGYEVDFDEAMRRQGQYRTEEAAARENHVCRIGRGK